jgi:hypothetical protein
MTPAKLMYPNGGPFGLSHIIELLKTYHQCGHLKEAVAQLEMHLAMVED